MNLGLVLLYYMWRWKCRSRMWSQRLSLKLCDDWGASWPIPYSVRYYEVIWWLYSFGEEVMGELLILRAHNLVKIILRQWIMHDFSSYIVQMARHCWAWTHLTLLYVKLGMSFSRVKPKTLLKVVWWSRCKLAYPL